MASTSCRLWMICRRFSPLCPFENTSTSSCNLRKRVSTLVAPVWNGADLSHHVLSPSPCLGAVSLHLGVVRVISFDTSLLHCAPPLAFACRLPVSNRSSRVCRLSPCPFPLRCHLLAVLRHSLTASSSFSVHLLNSLFLCFCVPSNFQQAPHCFCKLHQQLERY
jgi:hypothetical protein